MTDLMQETKKQPNLGMLTITQEVTQMKLKL